MKERDYIQIKLYKNSLRARSGPKAITSRPSDLIDKVIYPTIKNIHFNQVPRAILKNNHTRETKKASSNFRVNNQ